MSSATAAFMQDAISQATAVSATSRELSEVSRAWEHSHYNAGIGRDDIFDKLKEECGVFGVFNIPNASSLSYYGLHALQHRGEESSGMCTVDSTGSVSSEFTYHRGMGAGQGSVHDRHSGFAAR